MGLVLLCVSAGFPSIIEYLLMSSVPCRLKPLSAFTFQTLLGLTSTLTDLALNWNMGKFKISFFSSSQTPAHLAARVDVSPVFQLQDLSEYGNSSLLLRGINNTAVFHYEN